MPSRPRAASAVVALALLAACEKAPPPPPADTATPAPAPAPAAEPAPATAPANFRIRIETSRGPLVVEAHRDWSPNGVDRLFQLVEAGYFDNLRFFRVVPGFVVQFGMHGDPATYAQWEARRLPDDPVTQTNRRGMISFATSGPNTRATQLFINLQDNPRLDGMGFSPVAQVVEGMSVVDAIFSGYGEGPDQGRIRAEGNAYLEREFPKLDYIRSARVSK
jgi:peptidyl-prolyl cis-trans isomerase A (cyclophilin A)